MESDEIFTQLRNATSDSDVSELLFDLDQMGCTKAFVDEFADELEKDYVLERKMNVVFRVPKPNVFILRSILNFMIEDCYMVSLKQVLFQVLAKSSHLSNLKFDIVKHQDSNYYVRFNASQLNERNLQRKYRDLLLLFRLLIPWFYIIPPNETAFQEICWQK